MGLLFSFFLSMGNVEAAVNKVWNLRPRRGSFNRLKMYAPFLVLMLLLVAAGGLLLLRARHGLEKWGFKGVPVLRLHHGESILFGAAGVLIFLWLALLLSIRLLPNTKVKMGSALFGSTAAVLLIYLLSRLLFLFPKLLLDQNRFLYGSLAIFPVALLLTYVFWAAALFGVAASFIHQRLYGAHGDKPAETKPEDPAVKIVRPRNVWQEAIYNVQVIYSRRKT